MRRDTPASIYQKVPSVNSSGIKQSAFTLLYANQVLVSWQPANLNPTEASMWGITAQASDAKKMFFDPDPNIKALQRVQVTGDTNTYEILGINAWGRHYEAILKKVEGLT